MNGMEWALNAIFKQMGIEPETGKKQLAETVQIVLTLRDQLSRIEADQKLILSLLRTGHISNEDANGKRPEIRTEPLAIA